MKEFQSAARAESPLENPIDIEFSLDGDEFLAQPPTSGQLTLFMASQGGGATPADTAKAMLELMLAVLGEEQYTDFENGLKAGKVDIETVMEVIEYLIEEWSSRPTPPASDSSSRQGRTGKQSTAKRRNEESTPSD